MKIRYWLIVALALYFIAAVAPFVFTGAVICSTETPAQGEKSIGSLLSANVARWNDPAWQTTLRTQLPENISIVLLQDDEEVFRSGKPPRDPTPAGYTQLIVMDGTREAGVADLYDVSPCGGQIYGTFATPVSLLVQGLMILALVGWLSRYILGPLSAVSRAALQIANGNLEFDLPPSRVREIAEVTTAFHTMGDALRASLTRQAELEQERRFFIGAIAHDLRTPLFALRGYLEGLETGLASTPEKAAHYLAVCHEKADLLEHLIADLFAFSRLEYLEQAPQREPMDFSSLVNKAVDDIRGRAEAKQIRLMVEGTSAVCEVEADWSLLARMLGNLLDNALRYTPAGGTICITWGKESGRVQFSVADSGPGIVPHDLSHIFQPLYRTETSRNRQTGGAGLGLTIARRILRAHGGDLVATNQVGSGAKFIGSLEDA